MQMCNNTECPIRMKCKRFIMMPDFYQSYTTFENVANYCVSYEPVSPIYKIRNKEKIVICHRCFTIFKTCKKPQRNDLLCDECKTELR